MPNGYIPYRAAELVAWAANLNDTAGIDPSRYFLSGEQGASIVTSFSTLQEAYARATNGPTRGPVATAEKNIARDAFLALVRPLIGIVQRQPGMNDALRQELRITVPNVPPTPIGPPTVMPRLGVARVSGRLVFLELRRQDGNTRRKPAGVRSARLYSFVGETPPSGLEAWTFQGSTTKSDTQITLAQSVVPGSMVWVTGQWMSPTDEPGPACAPVQTFTNRDGLSAAG